MGGAVTRPEPLDRRRYPRTAAAPRCALGALVRPGHDARPLDLSRGGLLLQTTARLLPGRTVDIQLKVGSWRWNGGGEVVRCEVSGIDPEREVHYRAAIHFTHPLDAVVHACLDSGLKEFADVDGVGYGLPAAGSADPSLRAGTTRGQSGAIATLRNSQSSQAGRPA
jgi:hypothetical protein